jgi:hypothetical protein
MTRTAATRDPRISEPRSPLDHPAPVEVRSRFDGSWCAGFEVAEAATTSEGSRWFRLRRMSDGALIPSWFSSDEVHPA